MTGWFTYARPFARRRRQAKKAQQRHWRMVREAAKRERLWGERDMQAIRVFGAVEDTITLLWRDFIAHMERRG